MNGVQHNSNPPQKTPQNLKVSSSSGVSEPSPPLPPPEDLTVYKPAMFFDDEIYLRNCVRVSVGYVFKVEGGKYDGKKIVKIDKTERFYLLDDGTPVSMY